MKTLGFQAFFVFVTERKYRFGQQLLRFRLRRVAEINLLHYSEKHKTLFRKIDIVPKNALVQKLGNDLIISEPKLDFPLKGPVSHKLEILFGVFRKPEASVDNTAGICYTEHVIGRSGGSIRNLRQQCSRLSRIGNEA